MGGEVHLRGSNAAASLKRCACCADAEPGGADLRGSNAAASLKRVTGVTRCHPANLYLRGSNAAASLKRRRCDRVPDSLRSISAAVTPRPH